MAKFNSNKSVPLPEQLRPGQWSDMVGQPHLLGKEGWITRIVNSGKPLSILLWGPPGCGKTTLARLYASSFDCSLITLSGVLHGTNDVKKAISNAKATPLFAKKIVVFIDEIHRFNKAQQDALLPFVEDGTITLIGATTENPSFSLNNALLSRLRILILNPLSEEDLQALLDRYEGPLPLTKEAKTTLVQMSNGDARHLYHMLENFFTADPDQLIEIADLPKWIMKKAPLYDKKDEGHYNIISALHKAIRGSDPNAALYWLARMFEGGEDRKFIARRIIRMASEDIGLADPQALSIALDAWRSYEQLGSPEGELALAQAIIYLSLAPKSNAAYVALKEATQLASKTGHLPPPKTVLNAPTKLMKDLGYGKDYQYDHDTPEGFSGQNSFPDSVARQEFYHPVERGFEREMKKRLDYFKTLREKKSEKSRQF